MDIFPQQPAQQGIRLAPDAVGQLGAVLVGLDMAHLGIGLGRDILNQRPAQDGIDELVSPAYPQNGNPLLHCQANQLILKNILVIAGAVHLGNRVLPVKPWRNILPAGDDQAVHYIDIGFAPGGVL